jgi:hypothetical protein
VCAPEIEEATMADREDATLMVQLAQWGTMLGLETAMAALFRDDFDPETQTIDDENVRRVLQFGETVGTLTKNGLLSADLVVDWIWFEGMWQRVGPAALRQREKYGVPQMYENFEALAAHGR